MTTDDAPKDEHPPSETSQPTPLSPLAIVGIAYAIFNFLCMPLAIGMSRGARDQGIVVFMAIGAGAFAAQFGILPAWLVWGERPFWQRLVMHWGLAIGLTLVWVLGFAFAVAADGPPMPPPVMLRELAASLLYLPAISLGIEAPLWATRFFFSWRIGRADQPQAAAGPLGIRDFLWGMAIISVVLASVRAADAFSFSPGRAETWFGVAMMIGFTGLVSALSVLPVAWCILRFKDPGQAVALIGLYVLAAGVVTLVIISVMTGAPPPDGVFVASLFVLLGSMAGAISGAFGLARAQGYRLLIGSVRGPQSGSQGTIEPTTEA